MSQYIHSNFINYALSRIHLSNPWIPTTPLVELALVGIRTKGWSSNQNMLSDELSWDSKCLHGTNQSPSSSPIKTHRDSCLNTMYPVVSIWMYIYVHICTYLACWTRSQNTLQLQDWMITPSYISINIRFNMPILYLQCTRECVQHLNFPCLLLDYIAKNTNVTYT